MVVRSRGANAPNKDGNGYPFEANTADPRGAPHQFCQENAGWVPGSNFMRREQNCVPGSPPMALQKSGLASIESRKRYN